MHRALDLLALAATLSFTGCSKKEPDCASTVGGAVDRMLASAKSKMPAFAYDRVAEAAPKLTSVIVDVCTNDKWAADVLSCLDSAGTQSEISACQEKLPKDKFEKLEQRMSEALKGVLPGKLF